MMPVVFYISCSWARAGEENKITYHNALSLHGVRQTHQSPKKKRE